LNQTNSAPFTVYAPTNEAFNALGTDYLDALMTDGYVLHLSNLLLDHVQNGRFTSEQLVDGLVITMANGLAVTVANDGTSIQLITSSVELGETPAINLVPPEVVAQNGILHQVDSVILPSWYFFDPFEALTALPNVFGTFTSLIEQADLVSVFNNLVGRTIVGPNDAAFRNLPPATLAFLTDRQNLPVLTDVLVYHILAGLFPFPILPVGSFNASTLLGEAVLVNVTENNAGGKLLSFNGISGVGRGFYLTQNDLIYEVGGVLIPPSLVDVIPS
jgi:transforming growth factor-beta-induced protein